MHWCSLSPALRPDTPITCDSHHQHVRFPHSITAAAAAVAQPTVILWGASDPWEPVGRAKEVFEGWSADFVELPGGWVCGGEVVAAASAQLLLLLLLLRCTSSLQ